MRTRYDVTLALVSPTPHDSMRAMLWPPTPCLPCLLYSNSVAIIVWHGSLWGHAVLALPSSMNACCPSPLHGEPQLRSPASVDAVTSGSGLAGPLPRDTRGPGYHFPVPRAQLCGVRCRPSAIASTVPPGAFIVESPLLLTTPDLLMCVRWFAQKAMQMQYVTASHFLFCRWLAGAACGDPAMSSGEQDRHIRMVWHPRSCDGHCARVNRRLVCPSCPCLTPSLWRPVGTSLARDPHICRGASPGPFVGLHYAWDSAGREHCSLGHVR